MFDHKDSIFSRHKNRVICANQDHYGYIILMFHSYQIFHKDYLNVISNLNFMIMDFSHQNCVVESWPYKYKARIVENFHMMKK